MVDRNKFFSNPDLGDKNPPWINVEINCKIKSKNKTS